jgi:hypothetical protein
MRSRLFLFVRCRHFSRKRRSSVLQAIRRSLRRGEKLARLGRGEKATGNYPYADSRIMFILGLARLLMWKRKAQWSQRTVVEVNLEPARRRRAKCAHAPEIPVRFPASSCSTTILTQLIVLAMRRLSCWTAPHMWHALLLDLGPPSRFPSLRQSELTSSVLLARPLWANAH